MIVRRRARSPPPVALQPVGHHVRRRAVRIASTASTVVKTSELGDVDPKTAQEVLVLERNALRIQGSPVHQLRYCHLTQLGVPVVAVEPVPERSAADWDAPLPATAYRS